MNRKSSRIAAARTLLLVVLSGPHAAALAVTFTPGNIIVHNAPSDADDLYEYTPAGVFVQQVPVLPRQGGADLVIDRDGRVNINNSPTLNIYSPATNTFSTRTFAGWSTVGNLTYGGIAAFDRYVYAADMNNSGSDTGMQGVIRFDLDGGPTMRFATTTDPIDLNIGLDGLLYTLSRGNASNGGGTRVDVFNPISMAFIRGFDLPEEHRGIAVDVDGHIYTAQRDNVSRVNHFSPNGVLIDFIADPGVGGFADIDINRKGGIVIASHAGTLLVTTTALDSIISFPTRVSNFFNFASWIPTPIPEPGAIALLASGMAILAGLNRPRRRQMRWR